MRLDILLLEKYDEIDENMKVSQLTSFLAKSKYTFSLKEHKTKVTRITFFFLILVV
jgi:hypothetical protein